MNKCLFGLIIFLCLIDVVVAKSKEITILAPTSCQEWLVAQAEQNKIQVVSVPIDASIRRTWLLGLLTGLNSNYPSSKDLLSSVNSYLVFDWMDSYCKKNPKSNVYVGAKILLEELSKHQH